MTPAFGYCEDRDLVRFDVKIFGNSLGKHWNGELMVGRISRFQAIGEKFEFGSETFAHGLVKGYLNLRCAARLRADACLQVFKITKESLRQARNCLQVSRISDSSKRVVILHRCGQLLYSGVLQVKISPR